MSGIFHAMFVLARTIRLMRRFRAVPCDRREIESMSTGYNQAKNPATLEEKFEDALQTIERNATLTDFGAEILASCCRMVSP